MEFQKQLNKLNRYPFHMPGHKRNESLSIEGSRFDITETEGFDNLQKPDGIIREIETGLREIYSAKSSYLLVNGSTVGILAAVFAVCEKGDKIIIAKNCHKSVYNACLLRELEIIYAEPEFNEENGFYERISQDEITRLLNRHKFVKAVVITTPTYEGYISKITAPVPLIIDAAHGAHLGIPPFPEYPKGDVVISSLHKTLPALTGTAVANVYNEKYITKVKKYINIFQTSSPSYLLMRSAADCVDFINNRRGEFSEFYRRLLKLRAAKLKRLKILDTDDVSKITVSTAHTDICTEKAARILRDKYFLEPEAVSINHIILMCSVADTQEGLHRLKNALEEIDAALKNGSAPAFKAPRVCEGAHKITFYENVEKTRLTAAVGKISAEFIYAYPPDIPVITPGEVVGSEEINYLLGALKSGVNIISDSGLFPNKILTKREQ